MTLHLSDSYFVVVHVHLWPILLTALAVVALASFWKLRKR